MGGVEEVKVVGVDGCKGGWVAVSLVNARYSGVIRAASVAEIVAAIPDAGVIAVDIPIGIPDHGGRLADAAARAFLGGSASSVFSTPFRALLEAGTHAEASALARVETGKGITQQSYALRKRILEVDALARVESRIIEVHPEVSFHALAGERLRSGKKSWNGLRQRLSLLAAAGIELPDNLGMAGTVSPDDVADAAVAAWTGLRFARGVARPLPDPPPRDVGGRAVAIWY